MSVVARGLGRNRGSQHMVPTNGLGLRRSNGLQSDRDIIPYAGYTLRPKRKKRKDNDDDVLLFLLRR